VLVLQRFFIIRKIEVIYDYIFGKTTFAQAKQVIISSNTDLIRSVGVKEVLYNNI
jgi:hypothetical protein